MLGAQGACGARARRAWRMLWGVPLSRTNAACLALLACLLAVFAYQGLVDRENGGLRAVQDHVITWSFSRRVVEQHEYFRDFVYPLPAVIFKRELGRLGLGVSSVLWMALLIVSAFAIAQAAVRLTDLAESERAYLVPLLAFLAVIYFVQWDFRAVNSNTVVLALALWGLVFLVDARPARAGFLLAASIALKLYPLAIVPGLVARGRWRALAWCGLAAACFFVLLPLVYLGPGDAWLLTQSWLATIAGAGAPGFASDVIAYDLSLRHVLGWLLVAPTGGGAGAAGLSDDALYGLTRALQLLWMAALASWLWWERRQPRALGEGICELINASLALCAVLLLSPLLQPHHGLFLLAPAIVLAWVAVDGRQNASERILSGAALVLCVAGLKTAPSGPAKGLGLMLAIGLFSLLLVRLRTRIRFG